MIRIALTHIVVILGLAACAQLPAEPGGPDVDIAQDALNTAIRVYAPEGWNTFRVNNSVGLAIDVVGLAEIAFPADYGVRIFEYVGGEWREVAHVPEDSAVGFVLPPSEGDPLKFGATSVFPILPDADSPVALRIYIVGHVHRAGQVTDQKVGAFVDVTLSP